MAGNDFYQKWKTENVSLVVPITLMVLNRKSVSMTMIPAISMAAYTTYKVVMASANMKRARP